ncbi:MAG: hypothetical protein WCK89_07030 [bacterium]
MRINSRDGLNVIGLAAVTVAVMLLVLVLVPAVGGSAQSANLSAVGCRARDIYVAITGANSEREPLGLPPVWPSENPPVTNANTGEVECFNFSNSTDYFRYLYDEKNLGTDRWDPYIAGFDYSKLAGCGGVPACSNGKLTPEHNLWTVAMNMRDEMEDSIPILVTRNIDASSLAAKVTEKDFSKSLRFEPEWRTPFGDKVYVLIRKGGAIFKARAKYMSYSVVYGKQTFDATVDTNQKSTPRQLKYLTPTHIVVPGEQAYVAGAIRVARLTGISCGRIKLKIAALALSRSILPAGACVGIIYLLVTGVYGIRRYSKHLKPCLPGYGIGVGLFHYASVVFWFCVLFAGCDGDVEDVWLALLLLAVLSQLGGIVFVIACQRGDRAARQRGIKWMVAAPLILAGALLLLFPFCCLP